MLQVIQVVNRVFTSNTYVVFDKDSVNCWLVDIGDYKRMIESLPDGKKIRGLLLTHTHFDHIYDINVLCRNNPECVVYTSQFGKDALFDDKKNLSRYHENPIVFEGKHLEVVGEGGEIELFYGCKIRVIETPGHCPSCLTFYTDNFIFTGDSYIPGVKVVTKLPKGNKVQAQESVKKILELGKGKIICPGHGEMVRNELYFTNAYNGLIYPIEKNG